MSAADTSGRTARQVPAPQAPPPEAAPPELPPWRISGTLVGTTNDTAVIASDEIIAVDIATGEVRVTAQTAAEDPSPSFDRLLPRFDAGSRDLVAVDRLATIPPFSAEGVVVFLRGVDGIATSMVGLRAETLDVAWTHELGFREPGACATRTGVLIVPVAPDPARMVGWDGAQKWQREFGDARDATVAFSCRADAVEVRLKRGSKTRTKWFDAQTGDLLAPQAAPGDLRDGPGDERVHQDGAFVTSAPR